jgi:O-antigen/teichoic acid export membrane protein
LGVGQRIQESMQEKGHRQLMELLNELRVALPGVQVLFAFLLAVPFSQGWERVTPFQKDLYFASVIASAAATAFLIAPSAIHRMDFQRGDKPRIVMVSNVLAIIGLTFLALAIVGVVCLLTDILYGQSAVVAYTSAVALLFLVLWYVIPLVMRRRSGGREDAA